MDWIGWIKGPGSAALQWFEAHPGTASWLRCIKAVGQNRTKTPIGSGERRD
jgi:hypothetical protein